jgi:hypothetical protein
VNPEQLMAAQKFLADSGYIIQEKIATKQI